MAADLAGAAALAINAGVDMAMLPFNADQWQTAVQQDVSDHSISVATINAGRPADPHAEVPARAL